MTLRAYSDLILDKYRHVSGGALVVRGIMDMCTPETREDRPSTREYASNTCGRFVFDLLGLL